ncbi:MAG TPA: HesA/MoeB/ThiF family protein [Verrucomicrobiales bacterium]|nr:HesA/MoeB/ThiF family protein [Verrucomicrobiales bacterium]
MTTRTTLSDEERALYSWQIDLPFFGEAGQLRLRNATALVSRIGGLGGSIAFQLAAAGIGRLLLVHGGNLELSDLNRQILMRYAGLGAPRVASARTTLAEFNPHIEVETVNSHIDEANVAALVSQANIVFGAAPRFRERFLLNRECVLRGIPLLDAAVFGMEGQLFTVLPGGAPCLACLYPEDPVHWNRRFPVLGAVASLIASVAAIEGVKILTGHPPAAPGVLLYTGAMTMEWRRIPITARPDCPVCGKRPEPDLT